MNRGFTQSCDQVRLNEVSGAWRAYRTYRMRIDCPRIVYVEFETRQIAAPDAGIDFRTRERMPHDPGLPGLLFVQERTAQIRDFREFPCSFNQFLAGGPVEGNPHRIACRALRKIVDEGTPGSPSTSF
jgi:hypothetical protein